LTTGYIGPVSLDIPHIRENDEIKPDGSEVINIVCSTAKAKQLIGLGGEIVKNQYRSLRVVHAVGDLWGLTPVNTSPDLTINEGNPHFGWYNLNKPTESYLTPVISIVQFNAELISRNMDEILSLHYSRGGEDGTDLGHSYTDLTPDYIINESGADFDTTNDWYPIGKWYMDGGVISSDGSKINFSGGANVDGQAGHIWTNHRTQFSHNFIMEFTLLPGDKPSAGNLEKDINVWFSKWRPTTPPVWADSFLISLGVNSTNQFYQVNTIGTPGGLSWWNLVPPTVDNTPTAFKFRLTTDNKYYMKVELNRYVSGAWTGYSTIYYGPTNLGGWEDLYMGIYYLNRDSTTNSMAIKDISVYNNIEVDFPNVPVLQPGAVPNLTPDFYRPSEEGNIQCFNNIVDPLNFQIAPADLYKGIPKGMNSNYQDSTYRIVTNNDIELDIGKFYMSNGIFKLTPTSTGVEIRYWDGSAYVLMDTLTLPRTTRLIRPFYVSKEVFTLQLDRTYWTLRMGKPFIYIDHPYDDLTYTLRTCYEHDGTTTTSPAAGADISMLTSFYCGVWNKGTGTCVSPNPAQRYRMMILQQYPTTIKSNKIPANPGTTGIGVYDTNIADDAVDGKIFRAREFYRPTVQNIGLEGV